MVKRRGEIGLRRAVGARRRHIAFQIVAESGLLGVLGGLAGASLGILSILIASLALGWGPVLDPLVVVCAPFIGVMAGVLAGLYPAWKATTIEPTKASGPDHTARNPEQAQDAFELFRGSESELDRSLTHGVQFVSTGPRKANPRARQEALRLKSLT